MANKSNIQQVEATARQPHPGVLQTLRVARFELLRQFRRRRMILLLAIAGILAAVLFAVMRAFGAEGETAYSYASSYGIWVSILAALAATFFGGDALVGEFEHKTGYLLFPQPVTRTSIFLGKLLAALGLASLTVGAYYAIMAGATLGIKGALPVEVAYSFLLALLYTAAALGVAFLLSSALRSITMASVLTFSLLFFVLTIVSTILSVAGVRPDGNLAFAGQTIANILAGPYPEAYPGDTTGGGPGGGPGGDGGPGFAQFSPAVGTSIAVMAAWALLSLALALFFYRRREMKG